MLPNLYDEEVDFLMDLSLHWAGYIGLFLVTATLLEWSNPKKLDSKRLDLIWREAQQSTIAMSGGVLFAVVWRRNIAVFTPFHRDYFANGGYSLGWFVVNVLVYMAVMDTFFYWMHRVMHLPAFYKSFHATHHVFVEPTAFCVDAFHPIEGLLQGPIPHVLAALVCPYPAIVHDVFGALATIYTTAAHNGGWVDFNGHYEHHLHPSTNFGLFTSFWDRVCGTKYDPVKLEQRRAKSLTLTLGAMAK